jgi:integrase
VIKLAEAHDRKGYFFRTSLGHNAGVLLANPMTPFNAWRTIRRRALAAGIHTRIGNHSFRATGIMGYLFDAVHWSMLRTPPGFCRLKATSGKSSQTARLPVDP